MAGLEITSVLIKYHLLEHIQDLMKVGRMDLNYKYESDFLAKKEITLL